MGRRAKNTKTAVAYLRCSTTKERQALGVEAQRHAIETWAARESITIAEWHIEEVSGGAPLDKRPVLLEALASVAAHRASRLVVHRLDRFSRDPLTAALAEEELRRHGAALACADGVGHGNEPASELVRAILVAVHRFDRAMIGARIKAALAVKQRRGELVGAAPYGMRAEAGLLVRDERESATLEAMRVLRARGLTMRAIAKDMAEQGHVSRAGRPFAMQQVARLLAREPG